MWTRLIIVDCSSAYSANESGIIWVRGGVNAYVVTAITFYEVSGLFSIALLGHEAIS
jgi:hypothetical protein